MCVYPVFGSSDSTDLNREQMVWNGEAYVAGDTSMFIDPYQVVDETGASVVLASGWKTTMLAFVIDKATGEMVKVAANLDGRLERRVGRCVFVP